MFQKSSSKIKKTSIPLIILMLMSVILSSCNQKTDMNSKEITSTGTRIVTDMVGREVEIPNRVNKVFTTSAVGTIALYSINPSKIVGLNGEIGKNEEKYLLEEYQKLSVLGTYKDSSSGNEEEILKASPDIIISMGNLDESWIETANESQKKLGIPFLMVDGDLEQLDKAYEFLGDILGEQERCKKLADYCKKTINNTIKITERIPEKKRKKVYYASDIAGLSSATKDSLHAQAIDLVGAINVVESSLDKGRSGKVNLSMEQILRWNPEIIIANQGLSNGAGAYETIAKNTKWGSAWSNIDAVKNKQVYGIPEAPFNWFDRPPSVNRILGVRWLGNLIYPEYFKINIEKETKEFYKTFYHRELTDDEVNEILENAIVKK